MSLIVRLAVSFSNQVKILGEDIRFDAVLEDMCRVTGMGFAAIARVTEDRWIACQVIDRIGFGLDPGDELAVKTTICDDIRACGQTVVIDDVSTSAEWRTHPTPILYGFKSYVSLPIVLADGSFFGTLCAIDPEPRTISVPGTMAILKDCASRVAAILSESDAADARATAPIS